MYDALIIGAGPVALTMACALKRIGASVCLCGELPPQSPTAPDLRTAALFDGSLRMLRRLNVWDAIAPNMAPIDAIRIVDTTGHLLRAPEQLFSAADIGELHLGFNVPNPVLVDALVKEATANAGKLDAKIEINLDVRIANVSIAADHVTATFTDGTQRVGRVTIAADGRRSLTRDAARIAVNAWDLDQSAVTAHFTHAFDNDAISTELHTQHGPCTVVPMEPNRSSLVWMTTKESAAQLGRQSNTDFIASLEERLQGLLGPVSEITQRRVFPLSTLIAEQFASNRVALIGEAAHAFPPIGAQGLNLGLRDVASLTDHLNQALSSGTDPGAAEVLTAYNRDRRADIAVRTYGVDAFNRSLSGPVTSMMRGATLHALKAMPALRRFMMQRGTGPVGEWPSLMQPLQ